MPFYDIIYFLRFAISNSLSQCIIEETLNGKDTETKHISGGDRHGPYRQYRCAGLYERENSPPTGPIPAATAWPGN